MDREYVRKGLYQKYIEPTKRKRENHIGIEIEMPIINLEKEAVDFDVVHKITAGFMEHFKFQETGKDEEGNIYSVTEKVHGDILSYDCSYNNLELSLGKERELFTIRERFLSYYRYLQEEFGKYHYTLTGMGVNPYRIYNHNVPIPNGRYRMLFHHLNSYKNYDVPMYFHPYPEYGTFSSASQVQLDVDYEDLTFRGTIEFRSVCCQPIRDCMTVAAFHLGLKNCLYELDQLLQQDHVIYHHGYTAGELRKMFVHEELPSFVDEDRLYQLARDVLELAAEGLARRGYGEACMLEPLYERLESKKNPAKRMLDMRKQGVDIQEIILEYGRV